MAKLYGHEYLCERCDEGYGVRHTSDRLFADPCPRCGFDLNDPIEIEEVEDNYGKD